MWSGNAGGAGTGEGREDLKSLLWRLRYRIVGLAVLIAGLGIVLASSIPTSYTAEAVIMLENQPEAVDDGAMYRELPVDVDTVRNEIQRLRSRGMWELAMARDNLDDRPTAVEDAEPGPVSRLVGWLASLTGKPAPTEPNPEAIRSARLWEAHKRLRVMPTDSSRVISISYMSGDPELSAAVVNGMARAYMDLRRREKLNVAVNTAAWLENQADSLRGKLGKLEARAEELRNRFGLIRVDRTSTIAEHLDTANRELAAARAERLQAEAKLAEARRAVQTGSLAQMPEVIGNPMLERLREQEADLLRQQSQLTQRHGDNHPAMVDIRAGLAEVRRSIQARMNTLFGAYEAAASVAAASEEQLRTLTGQLAAELGQANAAASDLRAVDLSIASTQEVLTGVLRRLEQTIPLLDPALATADGEILSLARPKDAVRTPPRLLMAIVIVVASALMGTVLAIMLDRLRRGALSGREVEAELEVPLLGTIPKVRKPRTAIGQDESAETGTGEMGEEFAHAMNALCAKIVALQRQSAGKVIMITSTAPGEGKTTVSAGLARMCARVGYRTLLVDGDLRGSGMQRVLPLARGPGLADVLSGEMSLKEVVVTDPVSGLRILPAGHGRDRVTERLYSGDMQQLFAEAATMFDIILIDSPPVLVASDALALAGHADHVLFLIRWRSTSLAAARFAIEELDKVGASLSGAVMTMVSAAAHAPYGYGGGPYYSRAAAFQRIAAR